MATLKQKHFTWLSLTLLLISYIWFGWYLCELEASRAWGNSACYRIFGAPVQPVEFEQAPNLHNTPEPNDLSRSVCGTVLKYNLATGILAIGWILLSSTALISPITSFSAFVNYWFQSDTVAFTTIMLLAIIMVVILYWLHIFLQILTILAADVLARIDIQYAGLTGRQAFWILTLVSSTGLILGWVAHAAIT